MSKDYITQNLVDWGHWKRNYIVGLGFPSSGIEAKAMSGEIMGTGNYGGGRNEGSKNGVFFQGGGESEKIDILVRKLSGKYNPEMKVVTMTYVMQWSARKISVEMKVSRHTVGSYLRRGKSVINLSLEL